MSMIYLNSAGLGQPDARVMTRMIGHLEREAEIGPIGALAEVGDEFAAARRSLADLLGADAARLGICHSTCAMWMQVVATVPLAGRRVLVAPHEWFDNLETLAHLGAEVEALPELDWAAPDLSAWQERIGEDVAAICVPMVSSCAGIRYPMEAIATLARPDGCLLLVDGAQAVGQMEISVDALNCDLFVATTRKWLRAPRQTALFWLSDKVALDPHQVEPGDANVALRLGLGAATEWLVSETETRVHGSLAALSLQMRRLADALGIEVVSPPHTGPGGGGTTAVTLGFSTDQQARIAPALEQAGVLIKWVNAANDEPNSALAGRQGAFMRVSPHVTTRAEDIDTTFGVIAQHL